LKESDIEKARVLLASGKYSMGKVAEELQVSYTTLWRAVGKVAVG
jgi:predicted transcriptional regulator